MNAPASTKERPRPRVYYGWVIVATMMLVSVAETSEFNPVLGVFLKPITEEFGWSRATFATAMSIGTVIGGLAGLLVGRQLDRLGPRWMVAGAFLLLGGTMVAMAFIQELWQFFALTIVGRSVVTGVIALSISVVIAKWFVRRRGRAMALTNVGTRVGNAATPLFVQFFVANFGWRVATAALGTLTWGLTLLPTLLFLRRQPEDLGLRPDGDEARLDREGEEGSEASKEVSLTVREVLRTGAFYFVLLATSIAFFNGGGANFHMFAHLTDRGIPGDQAIAVIFVWSSLGAGGALVAGFLSERVPLRTMMIGSFLVVGFGLFLLSMTRDLRMAYAFAIVHGTVFGGLPTLQNLVWADYFGRKSLGAIRGLVSPVQMATNALGPLAAAVAFDALGNYTVIFTVMIALYSVAAAAMFLARPPRTPSVSAHDTERDEKVTAS
ncbi:MAG: MFS transporter [Chloroflexi bacterium]|nr:MFS transporter [Chloroflexota bacterium]